MRHRRAVAFAELLVVMSVMIVLVPIAIGFVTRMMHEHRTSHQRDDLHRVCESLTRQFREDVHQMQAADRVADAERNDLNLAAANGVQIVYRLANHSIERVRTADGVLTQRESYTLAEDHEVTCDFDAEHETVRLQVWLRLPEAAGERRLLATTISYLGQDWRYVPRRDWNASAMWDDSELAVGPANDAESAR